MKFKREVQAGKFKDTHPSVWSRLIVKTHRQARRLKSKSESALLAFVSKERSLRCAE